MKTKIDSVHFSFSLVGVPPFFKVESFQVQTYHIGLLIVFAAQKLHPISQEAEFCYLSQKHMV